MPDVDDRPSVGNSLEQMISVAVRTPAISAQTPAVKKYEVFAPPKNRWDDTLERMRAMKTGEEMTLTPDIEDVKKFSNQLRSMVYNRDLRKDAEYYFNISDNPGKVIVTKHELGWGDKQWIERGAVVPRETSVTVEKATTHSEKVTVATNGNRPEYSTCSDNVQEVMADLFLKSGGAVRLVFAGNILQLSKEDRNFIFGLVDRIQNYGRETSSKRHTQASGEKLYPVLMTLECLEDIYNNCMGNSDEENAERVAMLAAWFRGDPAVKVPKESSK